MLLGDPLVYKKRTCCIIVVYEERSPTQESIDRDSGEVAIIKAKQDYIQKCLSLKGFLHEANIARTQSESWIDCQDSLEAVFCAEASRLKGPEISELSQPQQQAYATWLLGAGVKDMRDALKQSLDRMKGAALLEMKELLAKRTAEMSPWIGGAEGRSWKEHLTPTSTMSEVLSAASILLKGAAAANFIKLLKALKKVQQSSLLPKS